MFVSMEVITTLASAFAVIAASLAGFAWVVKRMDDRFAQQDARIDGKFAAQDARIDARFAEQDARMEARFGQQDASIAGLRDDVVEVKVAIARLEGPPRRLLTSVST